MAARILAATLLLASSAVAIPTHAPPPNSNSGSGSGSGSPKPFKLTAQLTTQLSGGPNVEDYEVGLFSPKPDGAILTLTEPGEGVAFTTGGGVTNGTLKLADGAGDKAVFNCSSGAPGEWVVAPGGTATVPSTNTVNICCPTTNDNGNGVIGSSGFTLASNGTASAVGGAAGAVPQILNFVGGGWMACQGGVLDVDDEYNVLSFKKNGQRPILGCQDIDLVPVYM